jgi:hypothetical protein
MIRVVHPGSRIRMPTFSHPGSRGQKGTQSRIRIRNTDGMFIPDQGAGFFSIPDQRSKKHQIPDPQHCLLLSNPGFISVDA